MIVSFRNEITRDIYHGVNSKSSRKIPENIKAVAIRKLDGLNSAHQVQDLLAPPGNRLKVLQGSWKGFYSVRVNDQYRIVFRWKGNSAEDVEILDYHD